MFFIIKSTIQIDGAFNIYKEKTTNYVGGNLMALAVVIVGYTKKLLCAKLSEARNRTQVSTQEVIIEESKQ